MRKFTYPDRRSTSWLVRRRERISSLREYLATDPTLVVGLFVYPSRRLVISSVFASISRKNEYLISPCGAVSHHALACIPMRLDDIPQQVADDIQGLRLDLFKKV